MLALIVATYTVNMFGMYVGTTSVLLCYHIISLRDCTTLLSLIMLHMLCVVGLRIPDTCVYVCKLHVHEYVVAHTNVYTQLAKCSAVINSY